MWYWYCVYFDVFVILCDVGVVDKFDFGVL